jgi:hypothetical protein
MQVHAECMFPAIGLIVRRRRRTIMSHLAAATAALLLLAGALLAWQFYSEWRLGRIELVTEDAPVVAQVLAETSDTPIGEPFDLVTRAVVALPAGDYRLRVVKRKCIRSPSMRAGSWAENGRREAATKNDRRRSRSGLCLLRPHSS